MALRLCASALASAACLSPMPFRTPPATVAPAMTPMLTGSHMSDLEAEDAGVLLGLALGGEGAGKSCAEKDDVPSPEAGESSGRGSEVRHVSSSALHARPFR